MSLTPNAVDQIFYQDAVPRGDESASCDEQTAPDPDRTTIVEAAVAHSMTQKAKLMNHHFRSLRLYRRYRAAA